MEYRGRRTFGSGVRAARAFAPDQHVVRLDPVAEAIREALDRPLQPGVLERGETAAAVTDRVVMVVAARDDGLEAGPALADLDPLYEALGMQ